MRVVPLVLNEAERFYLKPHITYETYLKDATVQQFHLARRAKPFFNPIVLVAQQITEILLITPNRDVSASVP